MNCSFKFDISSVRKFASSSSQLSFEMMNTKQACGTYFFFAVASLMWIANGKWIQSNVTHFCSTARKCIISAAVNHIQSTSIDFHVRGMALLSFCSSHRKYCYSDVMDNSNVTLRMRSDEDQFCQMILNCYDGMLITSPTVDPTQLCPYSDFCQHKSSQQISRPEIKASCCGSCSCQATCGYDHNCCFKEDDNYNAIDTENLQCIKSGLETDRSFGFYMRDQCKNGTKCKRPNGPLIPAISQIKRRVYVSKECGECNDADDVESLQVVISCDDDQATDRYLAQLNNNDKCESMLYPNNSKLNEWISDFICPDEVISQCDPDYNNTAVIDECQRTHAQVRFRWRNIWKFYANIFCVACNFALGYMPNSTCSLLYEFDFIGKRSSSIQGFSILLDVDTLEAYRHHIQEKPPLDGSCGPYTVKSNHLHQPGCRPVLCPSGMIRTYDGSCKYLARLWFNVVSMIELSLRPLDGMAIPAKLLRNMTGATSISPWLASPCSTSADFEMDLCQLVKVQGKEEITDELIIRIYSKELETNPAEYLSRFANCLESPWQLDLEGIQFYLQATFLESEVLESPGIGSILGLTAGSTLNGCEYIIMGKTKFNQPLKPKINTHIKKLHFCAQVELSSNETELSENCTYLIHNNLTLGENYFDIIFDNADEDYVIRVCKEDYQYLDTPTGSGCTLSVVTSIYLVVILISYFEEIGTF